MTLRTRCFIGPDGKCIQCGVALQANVFRTCKAGRNPQKWNSGYAAPPRLTAYKKAIATEAKPRPGLGDYVESLLKSVGVTEDRYKHAKELFGLPPTCHCADRKAWLNKVSDWWRGETK